MRSTGTITEHPITELMDDAKVAFTNFAKQSKTLPEAVAEYKRRYARYPPRGFDHWWAYAKKHNFKLVEMPSLRTGPILGFERRGVASGDVSGRTR